MAEGIQECLETVQDIKACNQEEDYLRKLDAKMDAAEKAQISSEMIDSKPADNWTDVPAAWWSNSNGCG